MLKKLLAAALVGVMAHGVASAQFDNGDWSIYPLFYEEPQGVVDSDMGVFFVSDGCLFGYDKTTAEITSYTKRDKLYDNDVEGIYYNREAKYLLITYSSSNIDILQADGTVTNISGIVDFQLPSTRTINDVAFSGNDAYVATDFGYVVIDGDEMRISESNIFYTKVNSAVKVGNSVWLNTDDGNIYRADADARHSSLSNFDEMVTAYSSGTLMLVNSSSFLFKNAYNPMSLVTIDDNNKPTFTTLTSAVVDELQATGTGFLAQIGSSSLVTLDSNGSVTNTITIPSSMSSSLFSSGDDASAFWELSTDGVRQVALSEETLAALGDFIKPTTLTMKRVGNLIYNQDLDKLYIMTDGGGVLTSNYSKTAYVNTLQNGVLTDITPQDVPDNRNLGVLQDLVSPVFDPDDPETYYIGTWFEGAYKITGDSVVAHYDWNNSPMTYLWSWCALVPAVQLDANKNLWVIEYTESPEFTFMVLPRDKQSNSTITSSDWITLDITAPGGSDYRSDFLITEKSDIKIMLDGTYDSNLLFIDDGGDPSSTSIQTVKYGSFIDQDGNTFDATNFYCIFEDINGLVWLGTSEGAIRFDPTEAFNDDFTVEHIMATYDDGTSEYLLAGKTVISMASDTLGNLWMGTTDAGVYQISADGSEILNHFTTANSYLTSDYVLAIACKPDGSTIYFGTEIGMMEYRPNDTPSESDLSKVTVSPVNVAADYSGYVAIEHLTSGAYVTITDVYGNDVASVTAEGGVAQWNLCTTAGERVPTGKYYIYASSTAGTRGDLVGYVNALR